MKGLRITMGILVIAWLIFSSSFILAREIPYTQEDRDRLIRVEEGLKAVNKRIDDVNKRIDDMNKRIDDLREEIRDLKNFMLWGFGILFGGMGILIGLVIWDRRTALSPAMRKIMELEEKEERLERALKEFGYQDERLANILKRLGLL